MLSGVVIYTRVAKMSKLSTITNHLNYGNTMHYVQTFSDRFSDNKFEIPDFTSLSLYSLPCIPLSHFMMEYKQRTLHGRGANI